MLSTKIPFDSERSLALRTENGVIRRLMRIETNASVTLKNRNHTANVTLTVPIKTKAVRKPQSGNSRLPSEL